MSKKAPATSVSTVAKKSRSAALASQGVSSVVEFNDLMQAIASDALNGEIKPTQGAVALNAYGKILKAAELSLRHSDSEKPSVLKLGSGKRKAA